MRSLYKKPEALLEDLGICRPDEIDLEIIGQHCNATIIYEPLTGCEARIVGYGEKAVITVNRNSSAFRKRFSAGHELGHWMRDRKSISSFRCTKEQYAHEWNQNNPERRANRYAADLLLPESMFRRDASGYPMDFSSVCDLASRYRVSLTATAIRLVHLGSYPSMIVCNKIGERRWKWFDRSPDIPPFWPRDRPGSDTVAAELLKGSLEVAGPCEVAASGWFNQPEAGRYLLHEDSRAFGSNVLTMLWWKDEEHLINYLENQ